MISQRDRSNPARNSPQPAHPLGGGHDGEAAIRKAEALLGAPVDEPASDDQMSAEDSGNRSDGEIRGDVLSRVAESGIDITALQFRVRNGIVTLEGVIDSEPEKSRLLDIVRGCAGIQVIKNLLKLAPA
ncbi:MAG: hypothetical protein JWR07_5504 [Nevskia sp.]|nr:hypothetical protein [Nevskia sp.]